MIEIKMVLDSVNRVIGSWRVSNVGMIPSQGDMIDGKLGDTFVVKGKRWKEGECRGVFLYVESTEKYPEPIDPSVS